MSDNAVKQSAKERRQLERELRRARERENYERVERASRSAAGVTMRWLRKSRVTFVLIASMLTGFPAFVAGLVGAMSDGNQVASAVGGGLAFAALFGLLIVSTFRSSADHSTESAKSRPDDDPGTTRSAAASSLESGIGWILLTIGMAGFWLILAPGLASRIDAKSWRVVLIVFWGIIAFELQIAIATREGRQAFTLRHRRSWFETLCLGAGILACSTAWLTALLSHLTATGIVSFAKHDDPTKIITSPSNDQFYSFLFHEALDVVGVAAAFPRWEPMAHRSTLVGAMAVAYRIVVVASIIQLYHLRPKPVPAGNDTPGNGA